MTTTAPNTQSKATQFQKQLQQLQIQALIDSDNNSKLQVNSTDLIQNSKGNEIKLKNLKEDLAQIQLGMGHICNTKEALLGDLDSFQYKPPLAHLLQSLKALLRQLNLMIRVHLLNCSKKRQKRSQNQVKKKIQTLQNDKERCLTQLLPPQN